MIVIDTSAWIDHFRGRDTEIPALLENRLGLLHSSVFGELLLSGLPRNDPVVEELADLPGAPLVSPTEVHELIASADLAGTGVGYVDAHLLASARAVPEGRLLTHDKRLRDRADRLGVLFVRPEASGPA
jgi:predicted nucleic acid-binding protein